MTTRGEVGRLTAAALAAFLAILVVDFLTHAVAFAGWWRATAEYWRPPDMLFRHIPYAYAAFALYAAGLTWLLARIQAPRLPVATGFAIGLAAGALIGIAGILATYSVVPMPLGALVVFPVSFIVDFGAAGACAALVLRAERPWRRLALLTMLLFLLFVLGVVIQNLL